MTTICRVGRGKRSGGREILAYQRQPDKVSGSTNERLNVKSGRYVTPRAIQQYKSQLTLVQLGISKYFTKPTSDFRMTIRVYTAHMLPIMERLLYLCISCLYLKKNVASLVRNIPSLKVFCKKILVSSSYDAWWSGLEHIVGGNKVGDSAQGVFLVILQ